jgi:hypothetical protein
MKNYGNIIRYRIRKLSAFLVVVVTLALVTGVHAITIIIDGIEESVWITGSGSQIPGFIDDVNEVDIPNSLDVDYMRYTNDLEYFYVLLATYENTDWGTGFRRSFLDICLDTDNDTSTGFSYENCDGVTGVDMEGIDRLIRVEREAGSASPDYTLRYFVYDENADQIFFSAPADGNTATLGRITEIRIPLSVLNLDSDTTCNGEMLLGAYFDGQTLDPDDNVPDSGQVVVTCGSPTAVNLGNFTAVSNTVNNLPQAMGVVALLLLALLSLGFVIVRRQSAQV